MVKIQRCTVEKNLFPLLVSQPPTSSPEKQSMFSVSCISSQQELIDVESNIYTYIYMSTYISTNISVTPFTFFLNQMAMYIMFIILLLAVFAIIHVLETSMSISISVCNKFLWLHSILLYGYAMIYLISPLLVNSWVCA